MQGAAVLAVRSGKGDPALAGWLRESAMAGESATLRDWARRTSRAETGSDWTAWAAAQPRPRTAAGLLRHGSRREPRPTLPARCGDGTLDPPMPTPANQPHSPRPSRVPTPIALADHPCARSPVSPAPSAAWRQAHHRLPYVHNADEHRVRQPGAAHAEDGGTIGRTTTTGSRLIYVDVVVDVLHYLKLRAKPDTAPPRARCRRHPDRVGHRVALGHLAPDFFSGTAAGGARGDRVRDSHLLPSLARLPAIGPRSSRHS